MRKLSLVAILFLLLFLSQSCEVDPVIPTNPIGPTVTLLSGTGLVSSSTTWQQDSFFVVRVSATAGDNPLSGLFIREDGQAIDASRLLVDGQQPPSSGLQVPAADLSGFTYDISIRTVTNEATLTYSFEVLDDMNLTGDASVNITTEKVPVSLAFEEMAPYFWMDAMIPINSAFTVKLLADAGSTSIVSLTVLQDDAAVDSSLLEYEGMPFTTNPLILDATAQGGFEWEVLVRTMDFGTSNYKFQIQDADGEVEEVSINITTGTPVDSSKVVLLLNAGGPMGAGGVNLITGASTGSGDAAAHLVDKGIDTDLPDAMNWLQKIGPGPNAELRTMGTPPEGFSFEGVAAKELIESLYNNGSTIAETDLVMPDDIYLVSKDGMFFIVRVKSVNVTADDNDDFYEIEVKF